MRQTKTKHRAFCGGLPAEAMMMLVRSAADVRALVAEGQYKGLTEEHWLLESAAKGVNIPLNHDCSILDFTDEDLECSPDYA